MQTWLPFILPACGLFWVVVGATLLLRPTAQKQQPAKAATAEGTGEAPSPAAARAKRGRGLFWLAIGLLVLWFSDIRLGRSASPATRPGTESSPEPSTPNDPRLVAIIEKIVQPAFTNENRIGLLVGAVAEDGEALLGFGTTQLGKRTPPTPDTIWEIGSITKAFTGVLLAQAVERNALEVEQRMVELLPPNWTLPEPARGITLKHLTTHTSGLPRLPDNLFGPINAFTVQLGGDPYRDYSEDAFREALAEVELEFAPGKSHLYSNFAVGLLGYLLAARAGTDYETLVTREICEPLGMRATRITTDSPAAERWARGYRGSARLGPLQLALESSDWRLPNHLAAAGGIRSTGRDMLTFLKANMGRFETPLRPAIERSHQELFRENDHSAMGMNWIRLKPPSLSQTVIWHNGGTGGQRSFLGFTEDGRYGVFVLSNTSHSVDALAIQILSELAGKS